MFDPDDPPFIINPSTVRAMVLRAVQMVLFAIAFVTALLGFLNARDLVGLIAYLRSEEAVTGLTTFAGTAWFAWSLYQARVKKIRDTKIARMAPNARLTTDADDALPRVVEP